MQLASAIRPGLRGYLSEALHKRTPDRVIIPFAGSLDLAVAAVDGGIPPARIEASDIALYPCAVGRYVATGTALPVHFQGPAVSWLEEHAEGQSAAVQTACTLLGVRCIREAKGKHTIQKAHILREYERKAPTFLKALVQRLEALRVKLEGMTFRGQDGRRTIANATRDHGTMIMITAPHGQGWRKAALDQDIQGAIYWTDPGARRFDGDELTDLVESLSHERVKALALIMGTQPLEVGDPADLYGAPWQSAYVETQRNALGSLAHWVIANKPEVHADMARKDLPNRHWGAKYPIIDPTYRVKPSSRLEVKTERVEVVNYYRDLLQHRLGLYGGTTQRMVLLMDGYLFAVLGFLHDHWLIDQARPMINVYCFAAPHESLNLQKLAVFAQHSSWFWEGLYDDLRGVPGRIRTTMFTRHPSSMQARGIMKLVKREQNERTGEYQLLYEGHVQERNRRQCLAQWAQKWGRA